MSQLPIKFPAIGLGPDNGPDSVPGAEQVWGYRKADDLTIAGPTALRHGFLEGMLLYDSAGKAWRIRNIVAGAPGGSFFGNLVDRLFSGGVTRHVTFDVDEAPSMSFDDFKARVCRAVDARPDDWIDEEMAAGEDDEPVGEARQVEQVKKKIRAARTVSSLISKFEMDWTAW